MMDLPTAVDHPTIRQAAGHHEKLGTSWSVPSMNENFDGQGPSKCSMPNFATRATCSSARADNSILIWDNLMPYHHTLRTVIFALPGDLSGGRLTTSA